MGVFGLAAGLVLLLASPPLVLAASTTNLTVTEERREMVDFSAPVLTGIDEVVVTGPASPAVSTLDDLGGKEIFVRESSSYRESLEALNRRLKSEASSKPFSSPRRRSWRTKTSSRC